MHYIKQFWGTSPNCNLQVIFSSHIGCSKYFWKTRFNSELYLVWFSQVWKSSLWLWHLYLQRQTTQKTLCHDCSHPHETLLTLKSVLQIVLDHQANQNSCLEKMLHLEFKRKLFCHIYNHIKFKIFFHFHSTIYMKLCVYIMYTYAKFKLSFSFYLLFALSSTS